MPIDHSVRVPSPFMVLRTICILGAVLLLISRRPGDFTSVKKEEDLTGRH